MSKDSIEKGRILLHMRMKSCKHLGNPDPDLMKVPLEALHSLPLQQRNLSLVSVARVPHALELPFL